MDGRVQDFANRKVAEQSAFELIFGDRRCYNYAGPPCHTHYHTQRQARNCFFPFDTELSRGTERFEAIHQNSDRSPWDIWVTCDVTLVFIQASPKRERVGSAPDEVQGWEIWVQDCATRERCNLGETGFAGSRFPISSLCMCR